MHGDDATPAAAIRERSAGDGGHVVAVVMAAGQSRRMGCPKQTLMLGERTLLAHVMAEVTAAESLDRVILVTGGAATEAVRSVGPTRAEVVHNEGYGTGCASSLRAGLKAADGADALVMLLGDTLGVTAEIIDAVVGAWRARPTWSAVTSYRGGLGHPFVFSAGAFGALRQLHGDKAVWKIVDSEPPSRVARIPVDEPLPRDIDIWDDYLAVCADLGVEPVGSASVRPDH